MHARRRRARRRCEGRSFAFITANGGGHLDEGSAALLASIRGLNNFPRPDPDTNAIVLKEVERIHGAVAEDYSVA